MICSLLLLLLLTLFSILSLSRSRYSRLYVNSFERLTTQVTNSQSNSTQTNLIRLKVYGIESGDFNTISCRVRMPNELMMFLLIDFF